MWTGELPLDLVEEILIKLPVKPLLRFKCVCKSWESLINRSTFIKSHLSNNPNSQIYVFRDFKESSEIQSDFVEVDLQNCSGQLLFQSLTLPLSPPGDNIRVVGSCNGLLCVAIGQYQQLLLVNPSTRRYRQLPPISKWLRKRLRPYAVGLGYDCSADEYKVVLTPENKSQVYIYGSRSKTWRPVYVPSKYYRYRSPFFGKYTHGALHWIVREGKRFMILAFDLVNLKFTVDEYDEDLFGNPLSIVLQVVGGKLFLCCLHSECCTNVWVMEEYGVRESWSKLVSLDKYVILLAISNCGRRFLVILVSGPWPRTCACGCNVHWYDIDKKCMECTNTSNDIDKKSVECTNTSKDSYYHVCLQSLVPLGRKLPESLVRSPTG